MTRDFCLAALALAVGPGLIGIVLAYALYLYALE